MRYSGSLTWVFKGDFFFLFRVVIIVSVTYMDVPGVGAFDHLV